MRAFLEKNSIALISLAIAMLTLYLTQIRESDVDIHLGGNVWVYHLGKGDFQLLAPVSFVNTANRVGTVFRVTVLITRDDTPSRTYIMSWRDFRTLDGDWKKESDASVIAVLPNSSISKVVRFKWEGREDLQVRTGAYTLKLAIWDSALRRPASSREYKFVVNEETSQEISSKRVPGNNTVTGIEIYPTVSESVVMSPEEVNALWGI